MPEVSRLLLVCALWRKMAKTKKPPARAEGVQSYLTRFLDFASKFKVS